MESPDWKMSHKLLANFITAGLNSRAQGNQNTGGTAGKDLLIKSKVISARRPAVPRQPPWTAATHLMFGIN